HPNSANRTTSASGVEIYRDNLLGDEFYGNAFNGETVHNLVQRFVLTPDGATFKANRAEDEKKSQFFASTDNWFRPVEIRTGPDGALWIVDMYRFVIEHPRWIPEDRLAKLDVRAGDDKGRIFKTYPISKKLRPVPDLTRLSTSRLAQMLDTPNGTLRDLIHREIYQRQDRSAAPVLKTLVHKSKEPAVRVQALCALDGIQRLGAEDVINALNDSHPGVRREALRLAEQFLGSNPDRTKEIWWNPALPMLRDKLHTLVEDPDYMVRYQLALTLGEWKHPSAGFILAELAKRHVSDLWMRSAILTSAQRDPAQILQAVWGLEESTRGRTEMVNQLIATGIGDKDPKVQQAIAALIAPANPGKPSPGELTALATLLEVLERNRSSLDLLSQFATPEVQAALKRIRETIPQAGEIARNQKASVAQRDAAVRIIGAAPQQKDLVTLVQYATTSDNATLQKTALAALRKQRDAGLPKLILPGWKSYLPAVRAQLLEFLLAREEGSQAVLDAVEQGTISTAEISLNARQQLTSHSNAKIQRQAKKLFPVNESRQAVLGKFLVEVPQLTGDKAKGAELYNQMCANCHTLRGQGIAVGPDLTPIANKSIADFLVAILDPNAVIEPRVIQDNVELKDDRSLSGVISGETATSITLHQVGGAKENILRSEIAEVKASAFSLMPEGLEEGRNSQDFADLIAFIQDASQKSAPAAAVSAPRSEPIKRVQVDRAKLFDGATNGIAKLISASEQLDYPSWIGVLPMAHCRQTDGKSKVVWQSAVMPDAVRLDQTYKFRVPIAMGLVSQPSGGFQFKANGKSLLQFDVALRDQTWKSADNKASLTYEPMDANAEDSSGVLTIELNGEHVQPGKPVTFEVIGGAADSQRWFGVYLLNDTKTALR
ncbi:MAG: c-type cytochrome, partial [Limisphaerales bacterium]